MSAYWQHQSDSATKELLIETHQRKFDVPSPRLETPAEIGSFSLDINKDFENSQRCLKYFIKPSNPERVNFDLRKGYDTMIKKEKGNELNILHWIVENPEKILNFGKEDKNGQKGGASGHERPLRVQIPPSSDDQNQTDQNLADLQKGLSGMKISKDDIPGGSEPLGASAGVKPRILDADFVCRRGLLAKIMCTPYEDREGWIVTCVLYNGTYYLNEIETEQKRQREANIRDDEMSCWGWKFEQYLTADSEGGRPNPDAQYNNCEAFYTVVSTKLNNHSMVFSGEVDALNVDKEKGRYYMEFKTTREFAHQGHVKTFKRFKIKKWWAQSYILGVKEIVCGFRDDNGIVHRLEFFNTRDLPDKAKGIPNPWKSNVCLNFLDKFLSSVKSFIKTDDKRTVHVLEWTPGGPVRCSKPLKDSEHNFLPDWYTGAVN